MKKRLLLLFLILILPFAIAENIDNYNTCSYLNINYNINTSINAVYDPSSRLDSLNTIIYLVPKEYYMQKINSLETFSYPTAAISKDSNSINYEWNILKDNYQFGLNSNITTENIINKIPHVDFPIKNLDPSYNQYLEPYKISDVNQEIIDKTNSLIQGEDDLFMATFKIADYVKNNIKYDINTLTQGATQKSTWVYQNKEGVCDEISSLFISMARSAGIPARFATGSVYTNTNYQFGNHGWAEVYFPGYGWVPYDVTFGEYGWIDPSHIKLTNSLDAGETSIKYSWKAYNTNINSEDININANVNSVGPNIEPLYNLKITPLFDQVGENSYVPLVISIENPSAFYVSDSLTITKAPPLIESNNQQVALKPFEKKNIYWMMKIPDSLNKLYIYNAELEVIDTFGSKAKSSIKYSPEYNAISETEANQKLNELQSKEISNYENNLAVNCRSEKDYYIINENAIILCDIKNTADKEINNLKLCLDAICNNLDLSSYEQKSINFSFIIKNSTKKIYTLSVKNNQININNFIRLDSYEDGPLMISEINYSDNISYNKDFKLTLKLNSNVLLNNLTIKINDFVPQKIDSLDDSKDIEIELQSRDYVNTPINIHIVYYDKNNKNFSIDKELPIKINNVPWYIKFFIFLRLI
jgi:hypothetical protein